MKQKQPRGSCPSISRRPPATLPRTSAIDLEESSGYTSISSMFSDFHVDTSTTMYSYVQQRCDTFERLKLNTETDVPTKGKYLFVLQQIGLWYVHTYIYSYVCS